MSVMVSTTGSEKHLIAYQETGHGLTDSVKPADSGDKKLSPADYIQTINVLFRDFTTEMADHDIDLAPQEMLQDYCASPTEIALFTPTALRQLHHFYANYVQSLQFLAHPSMDYRMNKKDVTRANKKIDTQPDLQQSLAYNLEQIQQAIAIYREKLLPENNKDEKLTECFTRLQDTLSAQTQKFCHDNSIDIVMPAMINQNHRQLVSGHDHNERAGRSRAYAPAI
jgi:hypothetical protein